MNKTVSVRKTVYNYSLSIPAEYKSIFEGSDHAIVEQKGNSLIYKPAEIRAKEDASNSELDRQI
ncbi:hypothetical protein [uncultured Methanomethylovorans sp.]|uniref:hypothetical protein n=1 Tax=uncultured Methanomethylovorans sp. TaxID=183759 RepID=UPI002AA83CC8|nr:hypothetical protein [uncultured Methanomethylovorans sp.]